MRIREYRTQFIDVLTSIYDSDEAEHFFYLILEQKQLLKRVDLALYPDLAFSKEEIVEWNSILAALRQEIPIQYLLGKTSFYGLDFEVNSAVLIPRPETEELVDWIITNNQFSHLSDQLKILDIGTGSGCIAISLAKNCSNARVLAIDVSEKALATAKKNAALHAVSVNFISQNILETADLKQQFDIIVSNPPYVRNLEKKEIKKNILENEPHVALFVQDDDPLIFYKKIAQLAHKNLRENGLLYFEINQYLGAEMIELLEKMNFKNIELRKDIYGNDRMIKGSI